MFIKGLNELSQSWLQGNTTLPYHAEKEEKELRIGDLKEKLLYSKLCIEIGEKIVEIGEKIGYPIKYGEKTQKIIEEFRSHKQRRIYIDFNYTNQQRLLDIKFPINNEYVVGIQIQGKQYRHFIEWYDNKELADKRWKSVSNEKLIKNFFDVTGKTGNFIKESKKEYNQFGNSFLYQYRTIKETTKDKIIEEIISEFWTSFVIRNGLCILYDTDRILSLMFADIIGPTYNSVTGFHCLAASCNRCAF